MGQANDRRLQKRLNYCGGMGPLYWVAVGYGTLGLLEDAHTALRHFFAFALTPILKSFALRHLKQHLRI